MTVGPPAVLPVGSPATVGPPAVLPAGLPATVGPPAAAAKLAFVGGEGEEDYPYSGE